MLITTLGWALVAMAVVVALVPVLYGVHLAVLHERLRSVHVGSVVQINARRPTSCPFCGEHLSAEELIVEAVASDSIASPLTSAAG
ncbi:MAG: hypothetical protein WA614_05740 [Acidimicrobiales bacterium]|jgi:hypothetical protein